MQKMLEGLKDFLYDSIDYLIMIGIIGLVVFIIGWRLDLLFAKDAKVIIPKGNIIAEDDNNSSGKPSDPVIKGKKEKSNTKEDPIKKEGPKKPVEDTANHKTITVTIPSGYTSNSIGAILESEGLVASKSDFIKKAEEMELSTKLKSGKYEIKSNSSIEDVLKILTK